MTQQHPITPPPELVQQWVAEIWHEGTPVRVSLSDEHIATRAAQWGADQELEACCPAVREQPLAGGRCGGGGVTIEEAKAAKMALRERINQALREFTDDTGLLVESLHVNQNMTMNGSCSYWVDVEVLL